MMGPHRECRKYATVSTGGTMFGTKRGDDGNLDGKQSMHSFLRAGFPEEKVNNEGESTLEWKER